MTTENTENTDNTELENNNQEQQEEQQQENSSNDKPNLFDGIESQEQEEQEEGDFDYSKILGEEFEDSEKEKIDNLREKYKDDNDLLKALYNANKLLGKKENTAPEKYEFEKAEDLEIDINEDIMESFSELAKENGLTNDQYNGLVNNFAKQTQDIMNKAIETERENIKKEIDSIDNFQTRASNLLGKAKSILSESEFKTLQNGVHSKEHFEVLEKLINASKNTTIKSNAIQEVDVSRVKNQISELTGKISNETNTNARNDLINERRALIQKITPSEE